MSGLKRILIAAAIVVAISIAAIKIFEKQIAMAIFDRAIEQNAGRDKSAALPDGIHVYMCGTGSPMADATRAMPDFG